jgi:sporulation protein YlmC with PRC-barrel domain
MLWHASAINGYAIAASDGEIGTVSDFLFDDASWSVRWLVVDTGNWLSGRKVLLPPSVLGRIDAKDSVFSVKLTQQQIKDSPEIDTDRPVSRQMETSVYDYYGWSPYWGSGFYMGGYGYMPGSGMASPYLGPRRREQEIAEAQADRDDVHLRSVEAVAGYHIHASDGEIGHVEDFLIEDADWSIHYLVVDTKNWWPGKKVLISPRLARGVDWTDKLVNLSVDRQKVKDSPAYDASITVDRAYEKHFHSYYGDVRQSDRP